MLIKSELDGNRPQFQRLYICLSACKKCFLEGCRHVIYLDGCHLKEPHPEKLLSVIGIDANNGMYPIAYAVAKVDSFSTYMWFLKILVVDLNIANSNGYVFMSDKQKGLINVIHALFPNGEHRHYLKHLLANFMIKHKSLALKQQMESITRTTTVP